MSAPLRFAANVNWLFTELPVERRFEAAVQAGFGAVELADPYGHSPNQINSWVQDAGTPIILINAPAGPEGDPTKWGYACRPAERATFQDAVRRGLDYATDLAVPFLHVLAGVVPEDLSLEEGFDHYRANIAWAAEQAAGTGVQIVLEQISRHRAPRFAVADLAAVVEVIEAIGVEHLGILFDVFHVQATEGNLIGNLHDHLELIRHVQIADLPGRHEPGTGEIDYPKLLAALAADGYQGWVGCEYHPQTTTVDGLGWFDQYRSR